MATIPNSPPADVMPSAFKSWAQSVVDALQAHEDDKAGTDYVDNATSGLTAAGIGYDNTESGLTGTTTQSALNELAETTDIDGLPAGDTPDGTELVPADQDGTTVQLGLSAIIGALAIASDGGGTINLPTGGRIIFDEAGDGAGTTSPRVRFFRNGSDAHPILVFGSVFGNSTVSFGSGGVAPDVFLARNASGSGLEFLGTPKAIGNMSFHGYVEQASDPAAPAANNARVFARDNGSGKTQLCVRFPTGAVQVLSTEP